MKKTNRILISLILISSLLLSIGYSAINNITLDIKGKAVAIPTTRILVTGNVFNKLVKGTPSSETSNTTITKIVFDYWVNGYSENGTVVFEENDWEKGTPIDVDGLGGIKLFKSDDGTKAYILSETDIYANVDCNNMFRYFKSVTEFVFKNFDTSKVNGMYCLFLGCEAIKNLDLSNFNTLKVTNMEGMFSGCVSLTSLNITSFDTSNVIKMNDMFRNLTSITTLDVSNFDTSKVQRMGGMFYKCQSITSLDLSNFDTSNVLTMDSMFQYTTSLKSLDLSNFNTSKVWVTYAMFAQMFALTDLNISSFDTSNVTNMGDMFAYTNRLTTLDLSNFDTKKVTNMNGMFRNMNTLKTIYVSDKWNTDAVTSSENMFINTGKIVGGNGTIYDSNYIDKTYARVDGGPESETPGYLTFKASN